MEDRLEKYIVSGVVTAVGGVLTYAGTKIDSEKGEVLFKTGIGFITAGVSLAFVTAKDIGEKTVEKIGQTWKGSMLR